MTEINAQQYNDMQKIISKFEILTDITIELMSEHNTTAMLEKILFGAISLTNADGGTIYRVLKDSIKIEIIARPSDNTSWFTRLLLEKVLSSCDVGM